MSAPTVNNEKIIFTINGEPYKLPEHAGSPIFCLRVNDYFTYETPHEVITRVIEKVEIDQSSKWHTKLNFITSTKKNRTKETPTPIQPKANPKGNILSLTLDSTFELIEDKTTVNNVINLLAKTKDNTITFNNVNYKITLYEYVHYTDRSYAIVNLNLRTI
ncbi:hypothetical protein ACIP01_18585 [Pseudomonas monteilii]|uniref:hypothetical protein n=1 Tax=Pseudomonas monteilii TaxID=76759 RepID=UPI003814BF22